MRISYWSSDVCSSDLGAGFVTQNPHLEAVPLAETGHLGLLFLGRLDIVCQKEIGLCVGYGIIRRRHCREDRDREMGVMKAILSARSEEHTSELQSLMRISYAVFCLKKKKYRKYNEQDTKRLTIPYNTQPEDENR